MSAIAPSNNASEDEIADDASQARASGGLLRRSGLISAADFAPAAVLSTVFAVISLLLVLSRSRNYIELADQSLYLLMIDNPEAAIRSASGYHVLISPLFALVGESVIGLRRLRAVLDVGVDIALGLSILRYLRAKGNTALFDSNAAALTVVSTIVLGGFAAWIVAVNGFGYDQLGAMIFSLLVTVVVWIIGGEDAPSKNALLAALGGAIFSLALIVRWTAALASLVLFAWVLIEHLGTKKTLTLFGGGFVGMVGSFTILHVGLIDLTVLAAGLRDGTVDISRDSHSLSVLLDRYLEFFVLALTNSVGLIITCVFTLLLVRMRDRVRLAVFAALAIAGVVLVSVHTVFGVPRLLEGNIVGAFLVFSCTALILTQARENSTGKNARSIASNLALPVTLTALPLLLAAGTLIPPFVTALPLATLWVAALFVAIPQVRGEQMSAAVMLIGVVLLSAMPLLLWQNLQSPSRTTFAENPVEVERGRFAGLLVDETTQELLHDLEDLRGQLDPNPTVLSFWVRPVVPFALEGTGIGFPWYTVVNAPNAAAHTISGACLDDGATPTGQVVFVTEERDPAEFGPIREALRDCEIDFPVDFELVTTMQAPDDVELFVYLRDVDR